MNEAETRADHIDPQLVAAGWGRLEGSRIRREYPITPGRIEGHGKRGKAPLPEYPQCGKPMRQRKSPKGDIWGCSAYPDCKGTRPR